MLQGAPHVKVDMQELGCDFYATLSQNVWTYRCWYSLC